jgi:hypothetical protein
MADSIGRGSLILPNVELIRAYGAGSFDWLAIIILIEADIGCDDRLVRSINGNRFCLLYRILYRKYAGHLERQIA